MCPKISRATIPTRIPDAPSLLHTLARIWIYPRAFEALIRPQVLFWLALHVCLDELVKTPRVSNGVVRRVIIERRVDTHDIASIICSALREVRQHWRAGNLR